MFSAEIAHRKMRQPTQFVPEVRTGEQASKGILLFFVTAATACYNPDWMNKTEYYSASFSIKIYTMFEILEVQIGEVEVRIGKKH